MSERRELTLEGIRRFHEDGAQTQRRLTKQAAAMGGLVLIHVPLPFKLPLQDGFRMGWDDDEAKFLELIHYPNEISEYIGEPIFSGNIAPIQMPSYSGSMRTVVRFGKPVALETLDKTLTAKAHPNFRPVIDRFPDDFKIEISQTLGDLLDEGLVALNFLIRSYRILEKDFMGGPVEGIESLPNNLFYTVWDIANVKNLDLGVQILRRQDVVQMGEGLLLVHASLQVD